jgi:hypothetical protein
MNPAHAGFFFAITVSIDQANFSRIHLFSVVNFYTINLENSQLENDIPTIIGDAPPAVVRAVARLLRPLVRFLLNHQFTYPMFIRLLKSIYVDVASQEFAVPGKEQTDSRVSLLTGVHRKDVKRLRQDDRSAHVAPESVTLGAQLVALWTTDNRYVDGNGRPRPLPRLASDSKTGHSFEELVASINTDIRPRVVLDEWLRLGVANVDGEDRVTLVVDAFIPEKGFDEKAYYLGQNLHDHIATCAHNLDGTGAPMLERSVFSDELSARSVSILAELAREQGMQALHALSKRAIELERDDAQSGQPMQRINFGIYFFTEPSSPEKD